MVKYLLTMVVLLTSVSSLCFAQDKALAGVWKGSIGKMAVTACFNNDNESANYYYLKHLVPIPMIVSEEPLENGVVMHWSESDGHWDLSSITGDLIEGYWFNHGRDHTLPVRLKRINAPESYHEEEPWEPCASNEFNLPMESKRGPAMGPVQEVNGVRYRLVTFGIEEVLPAVNAQGQSTNYVQGGADSDLHLTRVEVLGDTPGIRALNKNIEKILPFDEETIEYMYGLRRESLVTGDERVYYRDVTDISNTGHWLSFDVLTAGRNSFNLVQMEYHNYVYDTKTGDIENLLRWFINGDTIEFDPATGHGTVLPQPLADFIYSEIGKGDPRYHLSKEEFESCYGESEAEGVEYAISLIDGGVRFEVPVTRGGACGERIDKTFQELKPYLSKRGTAAVAEIR